MLGETIKIQRQKMGYTQEEVASRLHVSRQTISKWEKNYSVPDVELILRLAEILEVETSTLLGSDEMKNDKNYDRNQYALQLANIAEQMAIRNRRSSKIWKTVVCVLAVIVCFWLLIVILGFSLFSLRKSFSTSDTTTFKSEVEFVTEE